jgi:hypothetical protein
MIKVIPRYVDHLWYPILVKIGGGYNIIEMQGKVANDWNDMVFNQQKKNQQFY